MQKPQYFGNVNPNAQVYSPSGKAAPGTNAYAAYGAQGTFDDTYRSMGQKNAMDLSRAGTAAQNNYYDQASDVQNRGALQGLNLLGQQRENAYDRQNAMENMQYKWMQDMFGGALNGLL